ncbi:MAG: hypothetical protein U0Q22_09690 [Acidimicrobiales bacterium]
MSAPQLLRDAGLDAVIGMYPVVHRLRTTVVAPWASAATGDPAVRAPRRVLVYGPTGCGVRFIAARLADELAVHAGVGAVVLDALDDDAHHDASEVAALLDGPEARDVVLIGVSHRPWLLSTQFFDEGGFERMAFVPPPDWDARRFRLWETPWGSRLDAGDLDQLVAATEGWAGSDLALLGGVGAASLPTMAELTAAVSAGATDAGEWLAHARDLVGSLHPYGRVDDLVGYMQRYRLL